MSSETSRGLRVPKTAMTVVMINVGIMSYLLLHPQYRFLRVFRHRHKGLIELSLSGFCQEELFYYRKYFKV